MRAESKFIIAVADLETSGLDPEKHQIFEIGVEPLFILENGDEETLIDSTEVSISSFTRECEIEPDTVIDCTASRVNGIIDGPRGIYARRTEKSALLELVEFFGVDSTVCIAGINPHFDRDFILKRALRHGFDLGAMFSHRLFDLHTLAMFTALKAGLSPDRPSSKIYEIFSEGPEATPHTASGGAKKEADLIRKLIQEGRSEQ